MTDLSNTPEYKVMKETEREAEELARRFGTECGAQLDNITLLNLRLTTLIEYLLPLDTQSRIEYETLAYRKIIEALNEASRQFQLFQAEQQAAVRRAIITQGILPTNGQVPPPPGMIKP